MIFDENLTEFLGVISDKFKHSDYCFIGYFIGYKDGEIIKLLWINLPQISGYIKYFENGGKNMSFLIKNDDLLDKYNETWDKIKIYIKHKISQHTCLWWKYMKAKVKA